MFELATQMAAKHGWNTRPVSAVQLVDPEVKRGIMREMQRLQSATPEQHGLAYSFPLGYQEDGSYFKESNGYPAKVRRQLRNVSGTSRCEDSRA